MVHARLGAVARHQRETEMLIRFGLALCACWEFRMRFRPERDWRPWKCTTTMRIMCRWIFILVRDRRARRTHGGITNRLSSPRLSLTNLSQLCNQKSQQCLMNSKLCMWQYKRWCKVSARLNNCNISKFCVIVTWMPSAAIPDQTAYWRTKWLGGARKLHTTRSPLRDVVQRADRT